MDNLVLIGVPILVIALAMVFGYVLPTIRRRRVRRGPISIVRYDARAVLPPRPVPAAQLPETPQAGARPSSFAPPGQPAPARPAADQAVPMPQEYMAAPTQAMDGIEETEHSRAVAGFASAAERGRVLRLQVAGDRPHHRDDGHGTLRLERPADGTLQFLPGKLEIVEGRNVGQEIRFVRTIGADGTSVTFGRSEGPPYRHVQLLEQTVSRQHAKMTLEGRMWRLNNLSATNPVIVNGLALADPEASVALHDGDRIEMGEVVLRFRSK